VINNASLALIKEFEGLRLTSYLCPAGKWTIGYGHTGPDVTAQMTITKSHAEELLTKDLKSAEDYVKRVIGVTLNANQFGALVSLAFNVGVFGQGLRLALNEKNFGETTKIWLNYCNVNGKPSDGLKRRRSEEVILFNTAVKK